MPKIRRMNFQSSLEFLKIRIARFDVEVSQELRNLVEELDGYDEIYNNRDLFVPEAADRFEDAKEQFIRHMYVLMDIIESLHRTMEKFDQISQKLSKPPPNYRLNELSVGLIKNVLNKLPPQPRPEVPKTSPPEAAPAKNTVVPANDRVKFDVKKNININSMSEAERDNQIVKIDVQPNLQGTFRSAIPVKQEIEVCLNNNKVTPEKKPASDTGATANKDDKKKPAQIKVTEMPKPAPRKIHDKANPQELLSKGSVSMIEDSEFYNGRKLVFDSEQAKPTLERRNSHRYHQSLSPDLDPSDRWLDSLRKYKKPNKMLEHFRQISHTEETDSGETLDENNNEIEAGKDKDNKKPLDPVFKEVPSVKEILEYLKKQNLKNNKL